MRIDWLNDDLTEARVTRGWWRWKRQAEVYCGTDAYWRFKVTHERVPMSVDDAVDNARKAEVDSRKPQVWQPVRSLPAAKVVRR